MNITTNRAGLTVLVGHVGVDSGQLMICDPCYIKAEEWQDQPFAPAKPIDGSYPFTYNGACGATLSDAGFGSLGKFDTGVAFASGYGDGTYPVYATYNEDGRIARIEIVMIDENEIDDEDEIDEDDEVLL
jgi:hypothetical protein